VNAWPQQPGRRRGRSPPVPPPPWCCRPRPNRSRPLRGIEASRSTAGATRDRNNLYDGAWTGRLWWRLGVARTTASWELECAIGPRTAVAHVEAPFPRQPLLLEQIVEIAHARGVPWMRPQSHRRPEMLRSYSAAAADLVAYSGGKGLRGPQASGMLCGEKTSSRRPGCTRSTTIGCMWRW
jgi:hypothetical protein